MDLADLAKQVADLEKQIEKAAVESDNVPPNPLGKPGRLKKPKVSLHDNKATSAMDKAKKKSTDYSDDEDDEDDDDMGKALALVEKALAKAKKKSSDDSEDDDEDDDEIDKALEALNVVKARKKKAAEDDDEGMDDNWSEPADKKKMKKAARMMPGMAGRKKPMKKNLDSPASFESDSESLVFDGQHIAKADVGEQQFNIIKSMSARIAKAENDRQMAELRKRADDEYAHVPGTTDERASMLKAIGSLPESEQQAFEKVMRAHEKMAKSAFQGIGVSRLMPDMQKSAADFVTKVDEIKARDKLPASEAMVKARQQFPDLFKAYQGN